jgi:hypothetical protein
MCSSIAVSLCETHQRSVPRSSQPADDRRAVSACTAPTRGRQPYALIAADDEVCSRDLPRRMSRLGRLARASSESLRLVLSNVVPVPGLEPGQRASKARGLPITQHRSAITCTTSTAPRPRIHDTGQIAAAVSATSRAASSVSFHYLACAMPSAMIAAAQPSILPAVWRARITRHTRPASPTPGLPVRVRDRRETTSMEHPCRPSSIDGASMLLEGGAPASRRRLGRDSCDLCRVL